MYLEKRLSKLEDDMRKCLSALKRIESGKSTRSLNALKNLGYNFTPQMEEDYILLLAEDAKLFPPKDGEDWQVNIFYAQDTIIKNGENFKKCLKPHISKNIEEIEDVLLWDDVKSRHLSWNEPKDTYDSYMAGDIVECEGKLFKSTIDGNLSMPEPILKQNSVYSRISNRDILDNEELEILKTKEAQELEISQSSWQELK